MFDKLIESSSEGAEFKPRKSYFMVSSVVVGILFISAVVVSIFAADFDLGTGNLELAQLVAPHEMTVVEPEPPRPREPEVRNANQNDAPMRQANIERLEQSRLIPEEISTLPNVIPQAPQIPFDIGDRNIDRVTSNHSGRDTTGADIAGTGLAASRPGEESPRPEPETAPPPAKSVKPVIQSLGVVNGIATDLPKPPYPPAARAVGAQGKVDVQVLIDEAGRVISARALGGNPLLRDAAESAARRARFTPTTLSKMPVKVTGVIVYNFTR